MKIGYKFKTIRTRILILLLPAMVLSMLSLSVVSYETSKTIINHQINDKMNSIMDSTMLYLQDFLSERSQTPESMARTIEVLGQQMTKKQYAALIEKQLNMSSQTFGAGVWYEPYKYKAALKYFGPYEYRRKNKIYYTDGYNTALYDYPHQHWYELGINTRNRVIWTNPYYDGLLKITMVTAAAPFYDKNGKILGVTTADFDLSVLQKLISNLKIGNAGKAFIIDKNGRYIAYSDTTKIMKGKIQEDSNRSLARLSASMVSGIKSDGEFQNENGKNSIYYAPISGTNWVLGVYIPQKELYKLVNDLLYELSIFIFIGIVIIVILIGLFSVSFTRNIRRILTFVEAVGNQDFTRSINIDSKDELGSLAAALNNSVYNIKTLIGNIPGVVFRCDSKAPFKITFISDGCLRLFGYSSEFLLSGHNFQEIIYHEDVSNIVKITEAALKNGAGFTIEHRTLLNDGSIKWVQVFAKPVQKEGQEDFIDGVIVDISIRKQAEEKINLLNKELEEKVRERTIELQNANEELEITLNYLKTAQDQLISKEKMAALGSLIAGIAHEINTPLGVISSAGGILENIILNELIEIMDYYSNSSREQREILWMLVEIGASYLDIKDSSEERRRRGIYNRTLKDGDIVYDEALIEQLIDIGFSGDEESLMKIMAVQGSEDTIKIAYKITCLYRSTHIIRNSVKKVSEVILALKTYLYKSSGEVLCELDIAKDIDMVLQLYYNQTKYSVEIIRKYEAKPVIECYPEKIHLVWVNLLNNALQSMDYKGRLIIKIEKREKESIVSITDNGPGIPEGIKNRIFEPLFTTKMSGVGTGLGLDISKGIIEEIGGHIEFESQPGRTTFSVYFKQMKE